MIRRDFVIWLLVSLVLLAVAFTTGGMNHSNLLVGFLTGIGAGYIGRMTADSVTDWLAYRARVESTVAEAAALRTER